MGKVLFAGAAVLGLVGFGAVARGGDAEAPAPREYRIECRLVEYDSEGKKSVLSSPQMAVQEGYAGTVFSGQEMVVPANGDALENLEVGASMRVLVRGLKGGKVRLDASAQYSWLEPAPKSKLRIRSVGGRSIETVRLGEVFRVELEDGSGEGGSRVFEVTVQKADKDAQ